MIGDLLTGIRETVILSPMLSLTRSSAKFLTAVRLVPDTQASRALRIFAGQEPNVMSDQHEKFVENLREMVRANEQLLRRLDETRRSERDGSCETDGAASSCRNKECGGMESSATSYGK
jgi:hypothetical protein